MSECEYECVVGMTVIVECKCGCGFELLVLLCVRVLDLRGCGVGREAAVAHRGNRLHGEIKQVSIIYIYSFGAAVRA